MQLFTKCPSCLKSIGGLSQKVVTTGYKVVIHSLAMEVKNIYVNWLQSGYSQFSYELGRCNHFFGADITPVYFLGLED